MSERMHFITWNFQRTTTGHVDIMEGRHNRHGFHQLHRRLKGFQQRVFFRRLIIRHVNHTLITARTTTHEGQGDAGTF